MYDPKPMLGQIMRIWSPAEMGLLLTARVAPGLTDLDDDASLTFHHGGSANKAGEADFEPGLTLRQRIGVQVGIVAPILGGWEDWHTRLNIDGNPVMSCIAYGAGIDSVYGRYFDLRGHKWNGGQWGTINRETHATVFVCGLGQIVWRRGWVTAGMEWFCGGGPDPETMVFGHCDWNDDPRSKTATSCPGPVRHAKIHADPPEYIRALGTLRWTRHNPSFSSRGVRVRGVSLKLKKLGRLEEMTSQYRRPEHVAIDRFQRDMRADGVRIRDKAGQCGPDTYLALAQA